MATKLVIASGKSSGKAIVVKKERFLIGRAEDCDIRPLSDEVSRRHCVVHVEPDTVWVEDLGSRNGTFLNGSRIAEKTKIFDGDLIKVGSLELKVAGGTAGKPSAGVPKPLAAGPSSWSDDEEVSRWLMADGQPSGMHDTTQTASTVRAGDVEGPSDVADVVGQRNLQADDTSSISRMSIDEIKASRANPGGLPQEAKKSAASSREAAAEALKKLFGNR